MNLLQETKDKLKRLGLSLKDVEWFGSTGYGYSDDISLFEKLANVEYDDGYGSSKVAVDLVIVGKDFWLSRGEYDGSEWWDEHSKHSIPKKPKKKLVFSYLTTDEASSGGKDVSCGWNSLEDLNK